MAAATASPTVRLPNARRFQVMRRTKLVENHVACCARHQRTGEQRLATGQLVCALVDTHREYTPWHRVPVQHALYVPHRLCGLIEQHQHLAAGTCICEHAT